MAKALKKQRKPTAEKKVPTADTVWVQLGTPNEFGEKKRYDSVTSALNSISNHFHSQDGFITRSVREKDEVMKAINETVNAAYNSHVSLTPKDFEVLIDPYYNMRLAARIWRGIR